MHELYYGMQGRLHAALSRAAGECAAPAASGARGAAARGGSVARRTFRAGDPAARRPTLAGAARQARGQGTVEYVGLILLVAVILAGVVKASGGLKDSTIAEAVIDKLKGAIDSVGEG